MSTSVERARDRLTLLIREMHSLAAGFRARGLGRHLDADQRESVALELERCAAKLKLELENDL